jgi:hypothetical protein
MIRPEFVSLAKEQITKNQLASFGWNFGNWFSFRKQNNIIRWIEEQFSSKQTDELDFVCNYTAFIEGNNAFKIKILQLCHLYEQSLKQ